jgi:hypothetical protein
MVFVFSLAGGTVNGALFGETCGGIQFSSWLAIVKSSLVVAGTRRRKGLWALSIARQTNEHAARFSGHHSSG